MVKILDYEFDNSELLEQALTHSSFSNVNYERLEFLGDSILDFVVADILFKNKKLKEDELTRTRSNIVSEESLSVVFDSLNLEQYVKIGKSCNKITRAMKCDMYESVTATIYLTYGLDACIDFISKTLNFSSGDEKDYKTKFQEYAQKYKKEFYYKLDKTTGPAHDLTFYVSLYLDNVCVATASSNSKSSAEKLCAKLVLNKLINKEKQWILRR